MEEVATILNRLREAAGFSEVRPNWRPYIPHKGSSRKLDFAIVAATKTWAGDDRKRWSQLRSSLLRMEHPTLSSADARGVLIGWVGACLSRSTAQHDLDRLENRSRLNPREIASKRARTADISFWGRTIKQLEPQLPEALRFDERGAELLRRLMDRAGKKEVDKHRC